MASRLLHPRMMEHLERDFFPQFCALKKPVKTQGTTGQQKNTYETIHAAVPCRVGAAYGGERRTREQSYLDASHRIVLMGQFNDLTSEWQAEVDGVAYDILLPTVSAEESTTRLEVRIVS